jgi:DNA-directed RNA polymerase subunit M/transcription elongation factor TFIIS
VQAEHAGRRAKCAKCGHAFVIERAGLHTAPQASAATSRPKVGAASASISHAAQQSPGAASALLDDARRPTIVTFSCSLCDTRITVSASHVGKQVKCPDCGRINVVPPPPPPKKPVIPEAMSGPQYELWDADESPKPAAPKRRLHPVYCLTCGTLMYARDEHIGKKLKCPDCGALTTATPSPEERPAKSVLVADGEEYQIDETETLPVRPAPAYSLLELPAGDSANDSQIPAVTNAMAARAKEEIKPPLARPSRPRNPLITGVWRMLFTQEVIARWVMLSLVLGLVGQLLGESLLSPMQLMAEAIKIIFAVLGVAMAGVWLSMISPLMVVIVGESADGNDELYQPPQWLAFDWFGELFSVVFSASAAGLPAYGALLLAKLAGLPVEVQAAMAAATAIIVFPFALLSTMLEGTPLGVCSPRLFTSFSGCFGPWMLFYVETFLLVGSIAAASVALFASSTTSNGMSESLVWGMPPLIVAALLIDARLLGRLAWWISDVMPDDDDDV